MTDLEAHTWNPIPFAPSAARQRGVSRGARPRGGHTAMRALLDKLRGAERQGLAAPILLLMVLAMMVVPLAPPVLALMFTLNIAIAIVVLLGVVYVLRQIGSASCRERVCQYV